MTRTGYDDPIKDAPGMDEYADAMREATEMMVEYENLKETKIFKFLQEDVHADMQEALEGLIQGGDKDDEYRKVIGRCQYFLDWVVSLEDRLRESRTEHEPAT